MSEYMYGEMPVAWWKRPGFYFEQQGERTKRQKKKLL